MIDPLFDSGSDNYAAFKFIQVINFVSKFCMKKIGNFL